MSGQDGAELRRLLAEEQAEKTRVDRGIFESNRADRRARERENRRAIKAAAIQAITRTVK